MMAGIKLYRVVLRHGGSYWVASSIAPDTLHGPFDTEEVALLAAREMQEADDPNFVLDLTNADPSETTEFLK